MSASGYATPSIPGLQPAVVEMLPKIFGLWEGAGLPYMYTDNKGYVTTGTGNLIDPIGAALALPWKNTDGSLATQQQITDAWNTVKNAFPGVQSTACASLTTIRLDADGRAALLYNHLKSDAAVLRQHYPDYVNWPADAQMALHSIAWAWGASFYNTAKWKAGGNSAAFDAALAAKDFVKAAQIMRDVSKSEEAVNAGIIPRDIGNVQMLKNAAAVLANGLPINALHYPMALSNTVAAFGVKVVGAHPIIGGALGGLAGTAIGVPFGVGLAGGVLGAALGVCASYAGRALIRALGSKPSKPKTQVDSADPTAQAPSTVVDVAVKGDPQVFAAQQKLNSAGYGPVALDGAMGPQTAGALKSFQAGMGVAQTGALDAATLAALGKVAS